MDIGHLSVDSHIMVGENARSVPVQPNSPLLSVIQQVEKAYLEFALERQDKHFEARYELAKARSYIRIAKGKTRQIDQYILVGKRGSAVDTARAMLSHLEQSAQHLQDMLNMLN